MKILLLGANGQVGHASLSTLATLGEVVPVTRSGALADGATCERADLGDAEGLAALVHRIAPDVVVNAAAHTAVDRAEDEPELAFASNAHAPAVLAQACAAIDARLVHYSTDYVFDGQGTRPYREDDPTAPLGVYGASKLAGEQAIVDSGCRHYIFRTAWVYGNHGANFMNTMLRVGAERDTLNVVAEQVGTPTAATLIAEVTAQALTSGRAGSGTWHLTATGQTSWHGFAEAIFERARLHGLLSRVPEVLPISTDQYPTRAHRPAYSCLDTSALQADFDVVLPDWRVSLDRVLAGRAA